MSALRIATIGGAWLSAERARSGVLALSRLLAPHGYRLLVFKGAYLAHCVAADPWIREMNDADVVLVGGDFGGAVRLLEQAPGWEVLGVAQAARPLRYQGRFHVDLHETALPPFFGRLTNEALRARATDVPVEIFGPGVCAPDPIDAATITIAKFVEDRLGVECHGQTGEDLQLLQARAGVEAGALAARLEEHGLRMTGIVALAALSKRIPAFRAWLDALEPRAIELAWARTVEPLLLRGLGRHGTWVLVRLLSDHPLDAYAGVRFRLRALRHRLPLPSWP